MSGAIYGEIARDRARRMLAALEEFNASTDTERKRAAVRTILALVPEVAADVLQMDNSLDREISLRGRILMDMDRMQAISPLPRWDDDGGRQ